MALPESHYDLLRDAIFDNNVERFQELLSAEGVDVDHFDAGGQTMLHLASFWGRMPLVKTLLNAGASLKTKNAAGCTALDLATHWGHSSVAEVIRLRGGRSVWEEKMGQLQIRVEDLKLHNEQLSLHLQGKKRQYEDLLDEFHGLHKRHEEEKSNHMKARQLLEEAQQQCEELRQLKGNLPIQLDNLTEKLRLMSIEKARSDALNDQAQRELHGALAHRDQVLASMEESVRKQQEITQFWQQAESAAAISDSLRNFALAKKEKLHKQHTATLGELVLTTERLHSTEHELMTLRVELAEYIYGKERDQRVLRRAAQVLARTQGLTTMDMVLRPQTTPAILPPTLVPSTETAKMDQAEPILNSRKKAQFSKAAQEYGKKLRQSETIKSQGRQRCHEELENQYLTQGLSTPIVAAEKFQEAFVSSLNGFSSLRDEKWTTLRHDRDHQIHYARNVMKRRVIATTPSPLRRRGSGNSGHDQALDESKNTPSPGGRFLTPLRHQGSITKNEDSKDLQLTRPSTSAAEERLQSNFFQHGGSLL